MRAKGSVALVLGVVLLTAAVTVGAYETPAKSGLEEHVVYAVVAAVIATVLVLLVLYGFFWFRSPVVQRDSLQRELESRPDADAVDRVIAEKNAQRTAELLENNRLTSDIQMRLEREKAAKAALASFVERCWQLDELTAMRDAFASLAALQAPLEHELDTIGVPGTAIQRNGGCGRC